jgi:hypothetical protein
MHFAGLQKEIAMVNRVGQAVVVAAACILAASALAAVKRQSNANGIVCLTNLKQVGLAIAIYTQDYDDILPFTSKQPVMQSMLWPYSKNKFLFSCPDSKTAYKYNSALFGKKNGKKLGYPLKKVKSPATTVSVYDPVAHSDGSWGVVFVDGHGKRLPKLSSLAVK